MAKKIIKEFAKFLTIGVINTFIDLVILNLLSFIFNISSGYEIIVLNVIALTCAIINSYFMNKNWTFKKRDNTFYKEFTLFLLISIISGIINTAIVFYGTTFFNVYGVGEMVWLNLIKISASVVSASINFLGYKLIVFKKEKELF